jgi:hypothetical protein
MKKGTPIPAFFAKPDIVLITCFAEVMAFGVGIICR